MTVVRDAELLETIARGVVAHYARALKVQDRLDSLDGRSGPLSSEELRDDPEAASAVATDLLGEVIRVANDARCAPILAAVIVGPLSTRALAARTGVSRLVLARRLSELMNAGLVERDPNSDIVSATAVARALSALFEQLRAAVVAGLAEVAR